MLRYRQQLNLLLTPMAFFLAKVLDAVNGRILAVLIKKLHRQGSFKTFANFKKHSVLLLAYKPELTLSFRLIAAVCEKRILLFHDSFAIDE